MPLLSLAMEHVGGNYYVYGSGRWSGTASNASLGTASGPSDGFVFAAREVPGMNPTYLWAHPITGTSDEAVFDIALDGGTGLLAVGSTASATTQYHNGNGVSAGGEDAFLLNLSRATGAVTSVLEFGTANNDRASRVVPLANGDFLVAGTFGAGTLP